MDERLNGLRILVVEDETLIAMLLEDLLADFGCDVVGPVPGIEAAVAEVLRQKLDGALLDLNMHGRSTLAVAEALAERSVPFLVVSGYADRATDPAVIRSAPRLKKPFRQDELAQRMAETFAGR